MSLDPETCYRAMTARDPRFDGIFFVGVTTTGVYCRPICPARTPARDRCRFFPRATEAEQEGFRACFRCRPELAPGRAPVDATSRLVRAASARIEAGALNQGSVAELAAELGVTERHLRRALRDGLKLTPSELAQSCRLALAKQLLQDTTLPLAEVAFASGYASIRRFNGAVRERLGRAPSEIRREASRPARVIDEIALRLDYRAPLAWPELLAFLRARAIPGVESVAGDRYSRTVRIGADRGHLSVERDPRRPSLRARLALCLAPRVMAVVAGLRALFDLDAQPAPIAEHLRRDPRLAPLVEARPGLRVPGAFDPFETAVRILLGQQVSVRAASTLAGRLVSALGEPLRDPPDPRLSHLFPTPAEIAGAGLPALRAIGLPASRARALLELARAVARGALPLVRGADPEATAAALRELPGVGPWTAAGVAMRALGSPDMLPAADLVLRRALGLGTAHAVESRASCWRPWRAYAAMHLWVSQSQGARSCDLSRENR